MLSRGRKEESRNACGKCLPKFGTSKFFKTQGPAAEAGKLHSSEITTTDFEKGYHSVRAPSQRGPLGSSGGAARAAPPLGGATNARRHLAHATSAAVKLCVLDAVAVSSRSCDIASWHAFKCNAAAKTFTSSLIFCFGFSQKWGPESDPRNRCPRI